MGQSAEKRHEYYLKNKQSWPKWDEFSKEKQEKLLEYQRSYRKKNRKEITLKQKEKRQQKLDALIHIKGNKCYCCGNSYHSSVYDFHHRDPSTKVFTIGENMSKKMEDLILETSKCILVCSNCHRLIHSGIINGL